MTVGKAIETADKLRANNNFDRELKLLWLRQEAELLLPEPYDDYYPHYLCAQMDAALGETDRYANEMQLANAGSQAFAVWCRQHYLPKMQTKWRY